MGSFIFIVIIFIAIIFYKKKKYEETQYFEQTHFPFFKLRSDLGSYGEYLIYKNLQDLPNAKRFLFNVYLPKEDGTTTEVDVIMVHESGIYVFESKNYSGWIFGSENERQWTQTLPQGSGRAARKERFYNPCMQNETHIRCLEKYLTTQSPKPIYSVVAFSDRCELKKITMFSNRHRVVNRRNVSKVVRSTIQANGLRMSPEDVEIIYRSLYPCTQVSESIKQAHINYINSNIKQNTYQNAYHNTQQNHTTMNNSSMPNNTSNDCVVKPLNAFCPLCGSRLNMVKLVNEASLGKTLLRCSNFPGCSFQSEYRDNGVH